MAGAAAPPTSQRSSPIPPDDPNRRLTVADPDGAGMRHVSVAGGTYTILVSGDETAGRYCLIDMLVPDGGGPPAHRHDFEEMFRRSPRSASSWRGCCLNTGPRWSRRDGAALEPADNARAARRPLSGVLQRVSQAPTTSGAAARREAPSRQIQPTSSPRSTVPGR
jgi:hypothetical protein